MISLGSHDVFKKQWTFHKWQFFIKREPNFIFFPQVHFDVLSEWIASFSWEINKIVYPWERNTLKYDLNEIKFFMSKHLWRKSKYFSDISNWLVGFVYYSNAKRFVKFFIQRLYFRFFFSRYYFCYLESSKCNCVLSLLVMFVFTLG